MDSLQKLKGKKVEVVYQGMTYKGTLLGASVAEIHLQTSSSRVVLPMAGISSVCESSEGTR